MTPVEILKQFTIAHEESRMNKVWYLEPWLVATDGTLIAAMRTEESAGLPRLANDFPQFTREVQDYLEQKPQFVSAPSRSTLDAWAGEYDEQMMLLKQTRCGTSWGFPFDRNRVAKALKYLFPAGTDLSVDLCCDGDVDDSTTISVTRSSLVLSDEHRRFVLARARMVEDESVELQPIGDMLDAGDETFAAILGKLV